MPRNKMESIINKSVWCLILLFFMLISISTSMAQDDNVIDEVVWIVGDEPILKSDVEYQRLNAQLNGTSFAGDPYTIIPEQMAINKLFLHQADVDSIFVAESDVMEQANAQLEYMISLAGSQEKLEEYRGMNAKQIRQEIARYMVENERINQVKEKIIGSRKISPAEVRRYFKDMDKDSVPYIPTQVEVQILTNTPEVEPEEVDRVKEELQNYAQKVNSGESSFSILARMYSQDEGSARNGGEMDYAGRAEFVPEFSNVAFSLTDKNTVSKIVKTEYGYHIIQLVDRKGDKVKVRHILLKPRVSDNAVERCMSRLDSIAKDIRVNKFSFNEGVAALSDDKDTKNNFGVMVHKDPETRILTSRFQMKDLPQDVAKVVDCMHVGEISDPFRMVNAKGQEICAIVLLKNRIDEHRADITEDFQVLSNIVSEKKNEEILEQWIKDKQKKTYISIKDGWKKTDFRYPGWIK